MTQTLTQWRERLQQKLMAAIDAAVDLIMTDDLPALAKARARLKVWADLATAARKVLALSPTVPSPRGRMDLPLPVEVAPRKLDALKGGGRSRL